jgi:hypothetical protein
MKYDQSAGNGSEQFNTARGVFSETINHPFSNIQGDNIRIEKDISI